MAKWNSMPCETGILRKKSSSDKLEELLVFGYACKLFRDDEKALYIDQGKQLIPWMGNDSLKIDRYDCRGALSELTPYEASREGYDAMRWLGLSESERRIEQLCDEERFYSLKNNEDEEEMYKEEELKRLHQKRSEFQYSYDVPDNPDKSTDIVTVEPEDKPFVVPAQLQIPSDIEVPKTEKENARIEKTALFVSKQGLQMEILIKTKQAENPQFSFLNQSDPLYRYYKHVLAAIKSGVYVVESEESQSAEMAAEERELMYNEDHYLHPSLVVTAAQSVPVPTLSYKPSADCAYSQLVTRIQSTQSETATSVTAAAQMPQSYEQQYYQQYYYAAQYYEYYKQVLQHFHAHGIQFPTESDVSSQSEAQAAYFRYLQQQSQPRPTNPYAQIVSNLSQNRDPFPNVVEQPPLPPSVEIEKAPMLYSQDESLPVIGPVYVPPDERKQPTPVVTPQPSPQVCEEGGMPEPQKPLLSIAQYGSDSDDDGEEGPSPECDDDDFSSVPTDIYKIRVPTQETQLIIDKMALYVTKNGKNFEKIVRAKNDLRFEFLNDDHEFHIYYLFKKREYKQGKSEAPKVENGGVLPKLKEKKIVAPVSFSIKKAKEELSKEIRSALPLEESDEDERKSDTPPRSPSIAAVSKEMPVQSTNGIENSCARSPISRTPPLRSLTVENPVETTEVQNGSDDNAIVSADETMINDDPILEMIDLTDDTEEKGEDVLALQLERKRKAAEFLKLKSSESRSRRSSSEKKHKEKHRKKDKQRHSVEEYTADSDEVKIIEDSSEPEDGEIRKRRKSSSKKKKSHKRRRSRSRHRHRHDQEKEHKRSKKRQRRSKSNSSKSSRT